MLGMQFLTIALLGAIGWLLYQGVKNLRAIEWELRRTSFSLSTSHPIYPPRALARNLEYALAATANRERLFEHHSKPGGFLESAKSGGLPEIELKNGTAGWTEAFLREKQAWFEFSTMLDANLAVARDGRNRDEVAKEVDERLRLSAVGRVYDRLDVEAAFCRVFSSQLREGEPHPVLELLKATPYNNEWGNRLPGYAAEYMLAGLSERPDWLEVKRRLTEKRAD